MLFREVQGFVEQVISLDLEKVCDVLDMNAMGRVKA